MIILHILFVGIFSCLVMDLWQRLVKLTYGINPSDWGIIGRWLIMLILKQKIYNPNIEKEKSYKNELIIGWVFHYFVGVVYGVFFAFLAGPDWIAAPTFPPAFIYALATIAGGWFLLHPGLGLGWAVSKVEHPNRVRMLGLLSHNVFGLGLWLFALLLTLSASDTVPV